MIVIVWGVSGCGKSTIGAMLARVMDCRFYDADDYHPAANIEKMRAGIPLNDDDRWPWLSILAEKLTELSNASRSAVLACSALKERYREVLNVDADAVRFVQLAGGFELIAERLSVRQHEFMNNSLLRSQFDALEPSPESLVVSIDAAPEEICQRILSGLEQT